MQNRKSFLIKYLALMLILVSALLLSACRTRITNNNEVSNVYYDEDGYISETYETRRSELSLSTAKKPILPDFGPIEDEEEDFETGESINYEPEEEEYVEPPEVHNANRTTNRTTRRTTSSGTTGGGNSNTTRTTKYTITFYGNEGEPKEQNIQFEKGAKLRFPRTTPTRKGYDFDGWWTDSKNGSKVDSGVEVRSSRKLYAHWKEKKKTEPQPKPTPKPDPKPTPASHKITLKFDDGGATKDGSITVTEDGKYSDLPEPSRGIGYEFDGWYDENGKRINNGDKVGKNPPKTLTAKWKYFPYEFWDNEFSVSSNKVSPSNKYKCVIDGGSEDEEDIINACSGDVSDDKASAQIVVKFIDGLTEQKATDEANAILSSGEYPSDVIVICIDREAESSDNDSKKLLYKMMIFEEMYGKGYWSDENVIEKAKGNKELNTDAVEPIRK